MKFILTKSPFIIILLFSIHSFTYASGDTLVFKNDVRLIGEIKKMEKGIIEMDVSFGDENFKIKWLEIKKIYTTSKFLISIKDKTYRGQIASLDDQKIKIFDKDSILTTCALQDIVYLSQIKDGFAERFNAAVEVGFNLTKSQNLRQFSFRSSLGYKTAKSTVEASYNLLRSSQSNTESVKRTDGLLNYRRLLFKKWYGIATILTLSNTEQKIDLRANSQLGVGNFIFSTNKAYWGIKSGVNNNLERFSNETESRNSWEGFLGTELSLYDVGDIGLTFSCMGYSSFTDQGRLRADMNLDVKYDLPLDLFLRFGFSMNYDNMPAMEASQTDYILRTGIGWSW